MKRVILDTNIYGRIVVDDQKDIIRNMVNSSKIIVYGNYAEGHKLLNILLCSSGYTKGIQKLKKKCLSVYIIRKQLRATPKGMMDGINLRSDLLRLYQEITKDRELEPGKKEEDTANNYYTAYRQLGGITSHRKLHDDFLIVASASLHGLDIIVSEDNATMMNELAVRSYAIVNSVLKINVPRFIGYDEFKKQTRT